VSRHRLDHPTREGVYAEYGHDHMLGFFVEVFIDGRSKPIAVLDFFKLGRAVALDDCFAFMIEHGLFTREELEAALMAIQDGTRVRSRKVQRVVEVAETLRT
jgi:hypothetical protein